MQRADLSRVSAGSCTVWQTPAVKKKSVNEIVRECVGFDRCSGKTKKRYKRKSWPKTHFLAWGYIIHMASFTCYLSIN